MINDEGVITLNITEYMDYGLNVFDRNTRKIGTIFAYESVPGYMVVRPHHLSHRLFHIPFHTVTHIDPREVFISLARAELRYLDQNPPPRSTDRVSGEGDDRAIATEPSRHTSVPVAADDLAADRMVNHVAAGFRVLSSELEDLGTITQINQRDGQMLIESGVASGDARMVPVTFLDFVDREDRLVYLVISTTDFQRLPAISVEREGPSEVVEVEMPEP